MISERDENATAARSTRGFTLVEVVSVISILSIIGLVSSYVIVESMKIYARIAPAMDASYQARLGTERMKAELRDMKDTASIATMTSTALTFDDSANNTIAYSLSGTDLLRNGDLMAQGVSTLVFRYWKSDGSVASAAADLHLIEIDLTVQTGSEPHRVQTAAFPRNLSP